MPQSGNLISPPDAPHLTEGSDQQPSGTILHMRALQVSFSDSNLYELESGDLLIKDVPLLAEGEWTDSAQKTPLLYPAKTLEAYATNWIRKTGYNRHLKGVPRDETNRVSEAINPHYGQFTDKDGVSRNAILSDLLVYGSSPSGRAMQELIKRKIIKYVSVEHGGDEVENPQTRRMEAASLVFGGFAFVNKGACKVCRINEAADEAPTEEVQMLKKDDSLEGLQTILQKALDDKFSLSPDSGGTYAGSTWIVMTFPDRVIYSQDGKKFEIPYMIEAGAATLGTPVEVEEVYVEKKALEMFPLANPKELMAAIQSKAPKQEPIMAPDTKELEDKLAAQDLKIKELSAAIEKVQKPAEAPKVEIPKELAELPGVIKELSGLPEAIKAIANRLDALEKDGIPKSGTQTKELEALPEYFVPVNRKSGTIGE